MKKTVKSLIIAASVAAVAGIGAVSFAAWSGGGSENVSGSVHSGTITVANFATGSEIVASNADITLANAKLMPIDQTSGELGTNGVYYYKATLIVGAGNGGKTIKLAASDNAPTGLCYHVKGADESSNPTTGSVASDYWTKLNGEADVKTKVEEAATYVVYVALQSGNSDYSDNAGKDFTLTFTLENAAA